jgi:hypothetical protein
LRHWVPRHIGVGLGESGPDPGGDDAALRLACMRHGVAHEMKAAALPGRVENLGDRRLQPVVRVGDDELDAAQAALAQAAQESDPEWLGFAVADRHAEHLATTVGVHRHRDDDRDGDDVVVAAHLDVGRIEPEVRPLALDRPRQEGFDTLVDLAAEPRDLALADASMPSALTRSSTERVDMPWT